MASDPTERPEDLEPQVEELVDQDPEEAPRLAPEVEARRNAAMALIRRFGDPVLKSRATPVDRFDDGLRKQVGRMAAIMSDALGVGFEAPLVALVNPEVEWSGDEEEVGEEGCLSIPGVQLDVERPVHVRVRARDEHGEERVVEASGLEARVIQHELDHLDGVLILDRTTREQRREAMRELREREQREREAA